MKHLEVLGRGRERTQERFTETVTVGRFRDTTNPATGDPVRTLIEEFYTGPAQIKYTSLAVSPRDGASQPVQEQAPLVKLPSGTAVPEGAEVHVTASTADADLVGRRYTIAGRSQAGQTTSARYPLKELS